MEHLYAIVVCDFYEKIFFIQKKADFDLEQTLKITSSLNKNLQMNYLQDYISKKIDFRLMDTLINSKIKVKLSLLGEITVILLYDSATDLHLMNLHNQRMIEAFYSLCKTKKLRLEMLMKKYHETNLIIEDTLHFLDPKIRINLKPGESLLSRDMISHSIYLQKFNRTGLFLRSLAHFHSSKNFSTSKQNLENKRTLKGKINELKFSLSDNVINLIKFKRNNILHQNGATVNDVDYSQMSNRQSIQINRFNSSGSNKGIVYQPSGSGAVDFSTISRNTGRRSSEPPVGEPLRSSSGKATTISQEVFMSGVGRDMKKRDSVKEQPYGMVDNIRVVPIILSDRKSPKQLDSSSPIKNYPLTPNQSMRIDASINSLKNVDLNNVLNSINFDGGIGNYSNSSNDITANTGSVMRTGGQDSAVPVIDFLGPAPAKLPRNSQVIPTNKSVECNLNQKSLIFSDVNLNSRKTIVDFSSLNNLVLTNQIEDQFDPLGIRKQIRCTIIEKGILLNNKGAYEDVKYRGQIALELTNNFVVNNKTLYVKVIHPYWNDTNYFSKLSDKIIVSEEKAENYKLQCRNIKTFQRILDYNPNLKIIEPGADFKVTGNQKEDKYKLEIHCIVNEKTSKHMKASQMIISIITKSSEIKILKTTEKGYVIDDKKISFTINDFHCNQKFLIGMLFSTTDQTFVEVVKINYRYMDVLPSSLNADLCYYDENQKMINLDVAKKCMVEIRFIP